jgi:hypothetical protein
MDYIGILSDFKSVMSLLVPYVSEYLDPDETIKNKDYLNNQGLIKAYDCISKYVYELIDIRS